MELDHKKYRWFFTKSGKLVVGGRSASQNDELLKDLKKNSKMNYIVMHTSTPGSPFAVILENPKKVKKSDLEQTACFTASFSRKWREGKKQAEVDQFTLSQLYKSSSMNIGTWGVKGEIKKMKAPLVLVLTKQKSILRAVPEKTVLKKETLLKIVPGKTDKSKMVIKIATEIGDFSQEEILSALPPGGVKILK